MRAWRASIAGLRSGIWVTMVESRIELVASATAASAVHASNHGTTGFVPSTKSSASATTSGPSSSSRTARLQFFPPDVRQEQHMEPQRVAHRGILAPRRAQACGREIAGEDECREPQSIVRPGNEVGGAESFEIVPARA